MLNELEFKYPSNMYFIALAVFAVVFFVLALAKKDKILAAFQQGAKTRLKALRTILIGAGLCLVALALAGPQVFTGYAEVSKQGLDIYVLMDTSKSMLTADITPDRLTIAKKIVTEILTRLEGDRIGFIPFASDAYIQMPLTDDYQLAKMFLDVMDTDMISGGGTNLAAAIKLANDSFDRSSGADRVMLILSDGEEHDQASIELLKSLTNDSVKIFAVGIGTEKGGLVPVYNNAGDVIVDYMKDKSGNPVTSRLNAENLKSLAGGGRGFYYQATLQGTEIPALLDDLATLKRDDYKTDQVRKYDQLYQYFLGPGALLFLAGWFIPDRKV